jgi:hypothetical protein
MSEIFILNQSMDVGSEFPHVSAVLSQSILLKQTNSVRQSVGHFEEAISVHATQKLNQAGSFTPSSRFMPSNEFFAIRMFESNGEIVEGVQGILDNPMYIGIIVAGIAIVLAVVVLLLLLKHRRAARDDVLPAETNDMAEFSLEADVNQIFSGPSTFFNPSGATPFEAQAMSNFAEMMPQNGDPFTDVE